MLSEVLRILSRNTKGPCPTCGAMIGRLPKNAPGIRCRVCGDYAIVKNGELVETPDDNVASAPTYAIALAANEAPRFPDQCVGCGRPAMARIPLVVEKNGEEWTIFPAFCHEHALIGGDGNPSGIASANGTIRVGSHRVWKLLDARAC